MCIWNLTRTRPLYFSKDSFSVRRSIEKGPRQIILSPIGSVRKRSCIDHRYSSVAMPDNAHSERSAERERILIYILRRDIRFEDNPIFHYISTTYNTGDESSRANGVRPNITHLLPIYIFPANQVETSGFLTGLDQKSPYDEARSQVARVWRTGPHRVKFMAEGVWDLKCTLQNLHTGSDLVVRVGMLEDVMKHLLYWYEEKENGTDKAVGIAGIWMAEEEGTEEKHDERRIKKLADAHGIGFKLWGNEKYYIDEFVPPFP